MPANMSTKRFGARYGRRTKAKFAQVEILQRAKHKCTSCHKVSVKRVALGIWHCEKCGNTFAGKAYTPS